MVLELGFISFPMPKPTSQHSTEQPLTFLFQEEPGGSLPLVLVPEDSEKAQVSGEHSVVLTCRVCCGAQRFWGRGIQETPQGKAAKSLQYRPASGSAPR